MTHDQCASSRKLGAEDAILYERFLLDSILSQSKTVSWQDMDALVLVENIRLVEMIKDPNRRIDSKKIQKLVQCWKSRLRITWNVMDFFNLNRSRRITKYVTELPEDNKKLTHFEEVATSVGQLVAMNQKEYHLAKNDYSFDALQTNCFGINIKL